MKVWVTASVFTRGIEEIEGTFFPHNPDTFSEIGTWGRCLHGLGTEWHQTREAAVARAEQMRLAKIASLRKQITKLEAMSFEEKP